MDQFIVMIILEHYEKGWKRKEPSVLGKRETISKGKGVPDWYETICHRRTQKETVTNEN